MKKPEAKAKTQDVVVFNEEWAKKNIGVGMAGVDPADIRPPQILLIQKSSDEGAFVDAESKQPKVGQFFHTGKNIIVDAFDCYFVWAAKGKFINRKKEGSPEQEQYQAIGLYGEDLTMFGYRFRSSALYALSPLFTAVVSQKKPMFALRVHVDTKQLTGDKGTWYIPVVHVMGPETDEAKLAELHGAALQFDRKIEAVPIEDEESGEPPKDGGEKVNPNDIPF